MVTEAEIISINEQRTIFTVHIPLFDTVNSLAPVNADAAILSTPGFADPGYKIGDIVWVAFEQNKADLPLILGYVYNKETAKNNAMINTAALSVTDDAVLPLSTKITNNISKDITAEDDLTLYTLYNKIRTLENKVELISNQLYQHYLAIAATDSQSPGSLNIASASLLTSTAIDFTSTDLSTNNTLTTIPADAIIMAGPGNYSAPMTNIPFDAAYLIKYSDYLLVKSWTYDSSTKAKVDNQDVSFRTNSASGTITDISYKI